MNRKGIALGAAGLVMLAGCRDGNDTAREMQLKGTVPPTPECFMILPDADTQADRGLQAEEVFGDLDYEEGIWIVKETGRILGFSQYEDAIIWPTSRCAATMPAYLE